MADRIEILAILAPGWILMMLSAAPAILAFGVAALKLRAGRTRGFLAFCAAATLAAGAALAILWDFLVGDALSSSSTAGLIFLVVPWLALIAGFVGLGLGAALGRRWVREAADHPAPGMSDEGGVSKSRAAMALCGFAGVPTLVLSGLITAHALQSGDMIIAERSTSVATLRELSARALDGRADAFAVPLFLGQNPSTPADVLDQLSRHPHAAVRGFVERHPNSEAAARDRAGTCPPAHCGN